MSSVSTRGVCGFIRLALLCGGFARTDDSNTPLALSVRHNKQASSGGLAHTEESLFLNRMARIGNRDFKRVAKDRHGLAEFDAVLRRVLGRFCGIPLELPYVSLLMFQSVRSTCGFSRRGSGFHKPASR